MDGSERLAQVFVELADTLVDEFDPVDFLQMLTDRSVELLGADAAGLMLADQRGVPPADGVDRARRPATWRSSSCRCARAPAWTASRPGSPSSTWTWPTAHDRWPVFTPAAVAAGFRATHALPLRLRRQVVGAMNLFTAEPRPPRRRAPRHRAGDGRRRDHRAPARAEPPRADRAVRAAPGGAAQPGAHRAGEGRAGGPRRVGVAEAFARMRTHARRTGSPSPPWPTRSSTDPSTTGPSAVT